MPQVYAHQPQQFHHLPAQYYNPYVYNHGNQYNPYVYNPYHLHGYSHGLNHFGGHHGLGYFPQAAAVAAPYFGGRPVIVNPEAALAAQGDPAHQGGNSIGPKNAPNISPKTGPKCHLKRICA